MTNEDRAELQQMMQAQGEQMRAGLVNAMEAFAKETNVGLMESQIRSEQVPMERAKLHFAMECYKVRLKQALTLALSERPDPSLIAAAVKTDVALLFGETSETPHE